MKKLATWGRATFVSPYLRRPLRPLDEVLGEREERPDEGGPALLAGDAADDASATWGFSSKTADSSD